MTSPSTELGSEALHDDVLFRLSAAFLGCERAWDEDVAQAVERSFPDVTRSIRGIVSEAVNVVSWMLSRQVGIEVGVRDALSSVRSAREMTVAIGLLDARMVERRARMVLWHIADNLEAIASFLAQAGATPLRDGASIAFGPARLDVTGLFSFHSWLLRRSEDLARALHAEGCGSRGGS